MLRCPSVMIETTLDAIRQGGRARKEVLVLWLGRRQGDVVHVVEAFVPPQVASVDRFRVPPEAMREVMRHLRETRTHICAQVHSHPAEAFHSAADDAWALISHVGAISIVVPYFGHGVNTEQFIAQCATYEFSRDGRWQPLRNEALDAAVRVDRC